MKRMKRRRLALLAAVLLLLLSACGGQSKDSLISTDAAPSAPQTPMGAEGGWEEKAEMDGADAPLEGGSGLPANAKVILTGELELETKEFDSAVQAVDALVEELGGWYESRSVNQGGSYRSINAVVRVPSGNFRALLERAGEAAHRTFVNEHQQDVSEAYYDSEARLTTQRTKLERLQTLLAQAESMEDIIALESAISDTELQIEYLTGSLRKYDSLVDYSTVNLSLREVYRLSTDQDVPLTFGQRLGNAFQTGLQRGVDGLEGLAVGAAQNWVGLLALAAVIAGAVPLARRHRRKRAARRAPPPPAQPEEPSEKK